MTDEEWRVNILRRLDRLEEKSAMVERRLAVDEVQRANLDKRLESIEDTLKWLVRLIIGALLLAMLSFFVAGGFYAG